MESRKKRVAELLHEHKVQCIWAAVFACMAVLVAIGTVIALRQNGRAMNGKELHCILMDEPVHCHTDECYDGPEGAADRKLICGLADFVVHEHDGKTCYDENGNLVCLLEEIEEHQHNEFCFETEEVYLCGMEEDALGHRHTEGCYEKILICQLDNPPPRPVTSMMKPAMMKKGISFAI